MLYAEYDGERVWASEFAKELANINTCRDGLEKYPRCPECDGRVSHHSESVDGRAAHFAHCSSDYGGRGGGGGNCGGATVGESAEHTAMKSIAASALEFALSDVGVAEINIEVDLPAPYSDADHRTGDVVIEFEDTDPQLGDGVIAEVQYKNKTKDKTAVTIDYLKGDHNYSVLWLWSNDFCTGADLPKDWNCRVVHEDTVRERVREQIWPPGNGETVWRSSGITAAKEIDGLSTVYCDTGSFSAEQYIDEARPDDEPDLPNPTFVGTIIDRVAQQIKESYDWSELTEGDTAERYIEDVVDSSGAVVPVRIPEHLMRSLKFRVNRTGGRAEPDKPSNPFDDIQCWNCGTFWWAGNEERYYHCPDCGEPVDLEWNVQTGRISEKPYHIEHGSDTGGEA